MREKGKSLALCRAFAEGCQGTVIQAAPELRAGPAVFYGVDDTNVHLWKQVREENRPYFYIDNSWFDATRGKYFRIARNAVQHSGEGTSNGDRWRKLGLPVAQWRGAGDHLVLCPQSESFMRTIVGMTTDWTNDTRQALAQLTPRPLRVRGWSADKGKLAATLEHDLKGAHALITHSSAAAITAILSGVPAICTGQCAATPMAGTLRDVQWPPMPSYEARWHWASVLADAQWTPHEMSNGTAWRMLEQ